MKHSIETQREWQKDLTIKRNIKLTVFKCVHKVKFSVDISELQNSLKIVKDSFEKLKKMESFNSYAKEILLN